LMNRPPMREDVAVDAGHRRPSQWMLVASMAWPAIDQRRGRVLSRGGNSSTGS
jgi:hypothetical protein